MASYTRASNPQDDPTLPTHHDQSPRGPKCTRDGEPRTTKATYAAATGTQVQYGADVNSLLQQLQDNLQNLQGVQTKQEAQDKDLLAIENRFTSIEGGLEGHGKIFTALSTTRTQQGAFLVFNKALFY